MLERGSAMTFTMIAFWPRQNIAQLAPLLF